MNKELAEFERRFASNIWQRGKEYYQEGLIGNVVRSGYIIKAESYGNSVYRLEINLKTKEMKCSCPCDFECKHLAALVIWLKGNKAIDIADLAGSLKSKTKDELIAILCNVLDKKPELLVYAQTLGKEAMQNLIKNIWFPKNRDYASMYSQLDYAKEAIIGRKDWGLAILLLRKLVDMYDHDSDELMDYISTFLMDLSEEKLAKQQVKEIKEIIKDYPFEF